jgi:hypothetical protein
MNFPLKVDLKHLEIIEKSPKRSKEKNAIKNFWEKKFRVKNGNFFNRKLFQKII